ncbi:hypothetical protein HOLleu_21951 [Holothuria leucospilota]|uniref:Uncharacterized protein n=1 Tax=Holothuria leucospilota TaxID=206669 RepID=A0A9Q1BX36_HOLLE|nr:hypothetical protein HOLleu_21951 [Holothuria leucospilota]
MLEFLVPCVSKRNLCSQLGVCVCVCVCVRACVCVCVTLASVRCNSTRESWTKLKLGIWICHSEKVCPIVFGGGQRSCGVTRGQRPKTLFARYLKVGSLDKFHTWCVDA